MVTTGLQKGGFGGIVVPAKIVADNNWLLANNNYQKWRLPAKTVFKLKNSITGVKKHCLIDK